MLSPRVIVKLNIKKRNVRIRLEIKVEFDKKKKSFINGLKKSDFEHIFNARP